MWVDAARPTAGPCDCIADAAGIGTDCTTCPGARNAVERLAMAVVWTGATDAGSAAT
eukprot:CAMPEP_0170635104 /NCGR_PEP_ID=MMETSP0224-20130122/37019_1 /TAXON_ID=285029 /ORGANISM="Togula jolla, Strain CCCM 725" /LENGTH=56 /DNA_ID=CAMNT_0010964533 /DNA_START=370 /DNA_END=540 /DNA_ORIENTATION=-